MKAPLQVNRDPNQWQAPDEEWLKMQVVELHKSGHAIAREVGCSAWTVRQWINKHNLRKPVPVSDDPDAPLKAGHGKTIRFSGLMRSWLYRQYVELDKNSQQIADEVGTSRVNVCQWLVNLDVPVRSREERGRRHSVRMSGEGNPAWSGGTADNYQRRLLKDSDKPKVCGWCGTTERLEMHHKDHDRSNGELSNLTWLCRECNQLECRIWALAERNKATWTIDEEKHELTIQFMNGG